MKHLKYYESFKQKNITPQDIVECISKGGVIYASVIKDFVDNDPEMPLQPLSVDEAGTVTIDYQGNTYEVELKNIDKIEWQSND